MNFDTKIVITLKCVLFSYHGNTLRILYAYMCTYVYITYIIGTYYTGYLIPVLYNHILSCILKCLSPSLSYIPKCLSLPHSHIPSNVSLSLSLVYPQMSLSLSLVYLQMSLSPSLSYTLKCLSPSLSYILKCLSPSLSYILTCLSPSLSRISSNDHPSGSLRYFSQYHPLTIPCDHYRCMKWINFHLSCNCIITFIV